METKPSQVAMLPVLDIWELPKIQESAIEYIDNHYRPINSYSDSSPIKLQITNNVDEYLLFQESELYLKLKLKATFKSDQPVSKAAWSSGVLPADNLMHSLFSRVIVSLNNHEVSDNCSNYALKSYLMNKIGVNPWATKSHLSTIFRGSSSERAALFEKYVTDTDTVVIDLCGPLDIDLNFQNKALLGGTELCLELIPNDPKFFLQIDNNYVVSVKATITDVVFYAHKIKVSPDLIAAHRRVLHSAPARYPYVKNVFKTFTIASGLTSANIDNAFLGTLPRRILIVAMKNSTQSGNITEDGPKFENANISKVSVRVDGRQFPTIPYEPKFTNPPHCIRDYRGFLKALNENHSAGKLDMSMYDWIREPIWAFNFAPDLANGIGTGAHLSMPRSGFMSINLQFASALTEAYNINVFAEFDSIIEIDESKNVFVT